MFVNLQTLITFTFALQLTNHVTECSSARYTTPKDADYTAKKGNLVQYRHGDVLIAGIFDVHDRGDDLRCSNINTEQFQKLEVFNMILDEVNNNKSILPGITLGSVVVDSCNMRIHATKQTVRTFFSSKFDNQSFVGAVEDLSSTVSLHITPIMQVLDLVQIGSGSTSPESGDRQRFPHLFRTVPSDCHQVVAILQMIQQLGWKYASIVYEEGTYGRNAFQAMKFRVEEFGICLGTTQVLVKNSDRRDDEHDIIIHNLVLESRARVVVLITSSKDAEQMMRAANRNPRARGHFIWIGLDYWTDHLPFEHDHSYLATLNNSIVMQPHVSPVHRLHTHIQQLSLKDHLEDNAKRIGRNPWFAEYYQQVNNCSFTNPDKKKCTETGTIQFNQFEINGNTQSVADATLALVNSLAKFVRNNCKVDEGVCDAVKNSTYLVSKLNKLLKSETFTGIHGETVKFNEKQDWSPTYDLYIYQPTTTSSGVVKKYWLKAGNYSTVGNLNLGAAFDIYKTISVTCSDECEIYEKRIHTSKCCWTCVPCKDEEIVTVNGTQCQQCDYLETPSFDRRICDELPVKNIDSMALYISYGISCLGILSTLLIAFTYYKNHSSPIVRASGTELCVCIWVGGLISFVNGFVAHIPATDYICLLSRALKVSGLTLQYSALLIKTLRVVIVFRTRHFLSEPVKRILRPRFQLLFTFILFMMSMFILIVWSMSNTDLTFIHRDMNPHPTAVYQLCTDLSGLQVIIVLAYPLLLMLISLVLATVNRDVPEGFNETKVVGFATYAVCIMWVSFIGIYFSNPEVNMMRMISGTLCVSCNALVLIISLFAYRCHVIVFQPERNNRNDVMKVSRSSDSARPSNNSHSV